MTAFNQGLRQLPALKSPQSVQIKPKDRSFMTERTEQCMLFGTNVAFRGLALDPYLSLSVLYPSRPSHTISWSTGSEEVEDQIKQKHRRVCVCSRNTKTLLWKPSNVQARAECQINPGRDEGLTLFCAV